MRICFVINNISDIGGVQRVLSVVANGLSQTHDVSILMTSPGKISEQVKYPLSDNIHVLHEDSLVLTKNTYLPYKVFRFFNKKVHKIKNAEFLQKFYFPKPEMARWNRFFQKEKFDVLIGVTPRYAGVVALTDCASKKVGWFHNTYDCYFAAPGRYQWRQENLYRNILKRLDSLVVLTDGERVKYASQLGREITRIYNPLSFRCTERSSLTTKTILFIGRLEWSQKGLDFLIEIIGKAKEKNLEGYHLVVVGEGRDADRFREAIKSAELSDWITLAGATANVKKHYLNSDVVLVPSRYEGFGLVVTEAMECGVPVISFATEGPSEIIEDGKDGYLIRKFDTDQFAERLVYLCEHDGVRYAMGDYAKQCALKFSQEEILKDWNTLLDSVQQC